MLWYDDNCIMDFFNPVLLFVIISLTACNVALMSFLHAVLKLLGL